MKWESSEGWNGSRLNLRWRVVGGRGGGDGRGCEEIVWRCRKKMTGFGKGNWSTALEQRLSCTLSMCEPEVHP